MRAIFYRDLVFFNAQKVALLVGLLLFTLWSLFTQQGVFTLSLFIGFVTIQIVAIIQEDVVSGYNELVYATIGAKPYIVSKYIGSVIAASSATLLLLPILLLVILLTKQSLSLLVFSLLLSWCFTFFILSFALPLYLFVSTNLSQVVFLTLFVAPLLLVAVTNIKREMSAEQIMIKLLPYSATMIVIVVVFYSVSLLFSLYYSKRS